MKRKILAGLAAVLVLLTVTTITASPLAETVDVQVGGEIGNRYAPQEITIQVGDTVQWTNVSGYHNVVAFDDTFSSGDPRPDNWTYSFTFETPGTYSYYCTPHLNLGMVGTVIVEAPPGPIYLPLVAQSANLGHLP